MFRGVVIAPTLIAVLASVAPAAAAPRPAPPSRPGACAFTRIKLIGTRLEQRDHTPVPDSGSSINLDNGVYGVSYDQVPAIGRSRPGDPVMTCLAKLPRRCPPGDRRGKWYTTTNLRTDEAWTLPDAEHMCGGA